MYTSPQQFLKLQMRYFLKIYFMV